jgi:hypothetical protein
MTYIIVQIPITRVEDKNIHYKQKNSNTNNKTTTVGDMQTTGKPVGVLAIRRFRLVQISKW